MSSPWGDFGALMPFFNSTEVYWGGDASLTPLTVERSNACPIRHSVLTQYRADGGQHQSDLEQILDT